MPPRNSINLFKRQNIFGTEIARFRSEQGLKQTEMVIKLQNAGWDVSAETMCKIEQGERTLTDVEFMFVLHVLKVASFDARPGKVVFAKTL